MLHLAWLRWSKIQNKKNNASFDCVGTHMPWCYGNQCHDLNSFLEDTIVICPPSTGNIVSIQKIFDYAHKKKL